MSEDTEILEARLAASPAALTLADKHGIDLTKVQRSPKGNITVAAVKKIVEAMSPADDAPPADVCAECQPSKPVAGLRWKCDTCGSVYSGDEVSGYTRLY